MFKKLLEDESGLSTIEILIGIIVLALLSLISYAALKVGVHNASTSLGNKVNGTVSGSQVEAGGTAATNSDPTVTLTW